MKGEYNLKLIQCECCGAKDLKSADGYMVCSFCGAKYKLQEDIVSKKNTTIGLNGDIENLLEKCKREPSKAKKYANLILDIDPTNEQAMKILKGGRL